MELKDRCSQQLKLDAAAIIDTIQIEGNNEPSILP